MPKSNEIVVDSSVDILWVGTINYVKQYTAVTKAGYVGLIMEDLETTLHMDVIISQRSLW